MRPFETELCELAYKYGSDKGPQINHVYTPYYYNLFKDKRESVKKVFEVGIADATRMKGIHQYQTGASLKMWRDFFPNAEVYGIDIVPSMMFKDERIHTYVCDSTDKEGLKKLIDEIGSDIDLVIDDGNHSVDFQIATCKVLKPLLQKDVIYIIEDVSHSTVLANGLSEYHTWIPDLPGRRELAAARVGNGPSKHHNKLVVVESR